MSTKNNKNKKTTNLQVEAENAKDNLNMLESNNYDKIIINKILEIEEKINSYIIDMKNYESTIQNYFKKS